MPTMGPWHNGASAAVALTFDNMGEAADINRGLWPPSTPIGSHYSVTEIIPAFLSLVHDHQIPITYFAEAWNLTVYPNTISAIARAGHEVAWHAWQHEAWGVECRECKDERANFERSFGEPDGMRAFLDRHEDPNVVMYQGFRPPGGVIHGQRTLRLCREYGLGYISPAAEDAALVSIESGSLQGSEDDGISVNDDSMVVLPFRWRAVDAYYYNKQFAGLRAIKGEFGTETQSSDTLVASYIKQIDEAIEKQGFLSLLFHPYITDSPERKAAMLKVVRHLVKRRDEGKIWLSRCRDIEAYIRQHPSIVGIDPGWDHTTWRR